MEVGPAPFASRLMARWAQSMRAQCGSPREKPGVLWVRTLKPAMLISPIASTRRIGISKVSPFIRTTESPGFALGRMEYSHPPSFPITGSVFAADRRHVRRRRLRGLRTGGTRRPAGPAIGRDRALPTDRTDQHICWIDVLPGPESPGHNQRLRGHAGAR